ncbi:MAG: PadR family transcriptional regulator [Desulfobacteraceae bacterium]|nr:PadR family transcriptional regulator [Desulfobacteraceae bacterium]MCF8096153.1 PadR family transcriptional regulator [Desulfobacteraceae bacterium]
MQREKHGFSDRGHRGGSHKCHHKKKKHHRFSDMIARRGPRIERGETRYLILDSLRDKGRHGYGIMDSIEEKTGGMYRPSPGTVYPALQALENLELIAPSDADNRKTYELTTKGRRELESQRELLEDFYEDMNQASSYEYEEDEFFEDIQALVAGMFKSISRAFRSGRLGADEANKIRRIIQEAAQKVDEILKQ